MNIFGRFIASAKWVHAIDLTAKHRYLDALQTLEKIYLYFSKYPEYFLLRGVVKVMLPNPALSVDDLLQAKKLITESKVYNVDEKKYLVLFANNLLPPSERNMQITTDEQQLLQEATFDISKVKKHLQKKFPIHKFEGRTANNL
jgi:hypothetical protein